MLLPQHTAGTAARGTRAATTLKRLPSYWSDNAIDREALLVLEVLHSAFSSSAEDAVGRDA